MFTRCSFGCFNVHEVYYFFFTFSLYVFKGILFCQSNHQSKHFPIVHGKRSVKKIKRSCARLYVKQSTSYTNETKNCEQKVLNVPIIIIIMLCCGKVWELSTRMAEFDRLKRNALKKKTHAKLQIKFDAKISCFEHNFFCWFLLITF